MNPEMACDKAPSLGAERDQIASLTVQSQATFCVLALHSSGIPSLVLVGWLVKGLIVTRLKVTKYEFFLPTETSALVQWAAIVTSS